MSILETKYGQHPVQTIDLIPGQLKNTLFILAAVLNWYVGEVGILLTEQMLGIN